MTQCQLVAEVGDDARFPELARGWFTGVLADVLPDLGAGLAAGPVLYKRDKRDASLDVLWGEPRAVYAELQVTKKPGGPLARWVQYTAPAWRRFLDGLSEYPDGAVIGITPLDERGRPVTYAGSATVRVTRLPDAPQWATFSFSAGAGVADPSRVAGCRAAFARGRPRPCTRSTWTSGAARRQAARRVFDVLAPVLIGGRARRTPSKFQPPLAYDVNADDHRRENA
jgi:hypothetical protein